MASDTYQGLTDPALTSLKGTDRWRYFRQRLLERDGGVCALCGQTVEMTDLDLDHIVPRAEGGPAHWDNLRATHRRCNRRRGGRLSISRMIERGDRTQRLFLDDADLAQFATIDTVDTPLRLPPDLHTRL